MKNLLKCSSLIRVAIIMIVIVFLAGQVTETYATNNNNKCKNGQHNFNKKGKCKKCKKIVKIIINNNRCDDDSISDDNTCGGGSTNHQDRFVGLWQAIDSFDGSTQLLSITCSRQGDFDVRLNDTAFTLSCQNQIGFARGVGSINRNVLTVELTLHCSNLDGTSDLVGSQVNEFVLDHRNGTLLNINDDPGLANVFHRISK